MKKFYYLLFVAAVAFGCSVDSMEQDTSENLLNSKVKTSGNAPEKAGLVIPTLSLEEATENSLKVRITAGETGATGGLSVRWMTLEDYETFGWDNDLAGHANLNANPQNPQYNLEPGDYFIFNLEDYIDSLDYQENETSYNRPLECGLSYMFIVQANQDGKISKSEYSVPVEFSTADCGACTYGKGWWRNHSNVNPGEQEDMWPVTKLFLGENEYTQAQMNAIFDVSNNEGNNLVILSHHLIAAKLNVANGVDASTVADDIEAADELIGGKVILEDSFEAAQKEYVNSVKDELEAFNESNPCSDEE